MHEVITTEVSYDADRPTMIAHLARPHGEGPWPAVLIGHDGVGLDDYQRGRADDLAAHGYVALAMDFHGGQTFFGEPEAMLARCMPLLADIERMRAIGHIALDVLLATPDVDAGQLFTLGYGVGGRIVLELAKTGVPFKAVAGVHPGLPEPDAHDWRNVNSTILLCTGSDDPIVTPDQVLTFSHALQDSGIDWRVTVYGGAKHAFWSRPTNPNGLPKSLVMFRRPCQVSATTRYMQSAIGEQFWISLKRVMAISSDRSTRTQTFVEWRAATVLCHNRTVVTPPVRVRLPRNGGASGRLASANPKPAGT